MGHSFLLDILSVYSGLSACEVDCMDNQNLTLTTEEVCKNLHIGRNHVAALRRSGELPGIRLGKSWIYYIDDVKAFIERNRGKDFTK